MKYRAVFLTIGLCLACSCISGEAESGYAAETEWNEDGESENGNAEIGLRDGIYQPDGFSWSGGSGRVEITCNEVEMRDGQAYAAIRFSSTAYEYVRIGEEKYFGTSDNQSTTFMVPVILNANNEIYGLTTKMSKPHEIAYTVYIELKEDGSDSGAVTDEKKGSDHGAPELVGLKFEGEKSAENSKYFKLYEYSQGISLLEIGEESNMSDYLIVPKETEIPAGLEKKMTIIQLPIEHAYICSESVRSYAAKNKKMLEKIAAVGMIADQCAIDAVSEAMISGDIIYAGSWKEPDYQALVKSGCDFVILPAEAQREDTEKVRENFETLGIPVLTEYSDDEEGEAAKEEWNLVYELLLG